MAICEGAPPAAGSVLVDKPEEKDLHMVMIMIHDIGSQKKNWPEEAGKISTRSRQ